jgi:hypothetical protein
MLPPPSQGHGVPCPYHRWFARTTVGLPAPPLVCPHHRWFARTTVGLPAPPLVCPTICRFTKQSPFHKTIAVSQNNRRFTKQSPFHKTIAV